MLSEREHRTLADIEGHLRAEDPALARRLGDGAPPRQGPPRWPYTVGLVLALVLLAVCLVLALPLAAAQSAVLAVLAAICRVRSRAHRATGRS